MIKRPVLTLLFSILMVGALNSIATAQDDYATWDVTLPRGQTREIDFRTEEGTWMAVDISPDGGWILFDLLGHIYRVSAEGGGRSTSLRRVESPSISILATHRTEGRSRLSLIGADR